MKKCKSGAFYTATSYILCYLTNLYLHTHSHKSIVESLISEARASSTAIGRYSQLLMSSRPYEIRLPRVDLG